MIYRTITILGPGLLGGSIAMAVREHMPECELRLWARREETLELAEKLGITRHTYRDIRKAVGGADLVILATPVGAFPRMVENFLPALKPNALVTDVGSVKAVVHSTIGRTLREANRSFIGSHPMAGAEKQGLKYARADLIKDAMVVLTSTEPELEKRLQRLARFWHTLGCRTSQMTPELHDSTVARISHVPHILAALCARQAIGGERLDLLRQLASTGFRDTTRVSAGAADMWADILLSNKSTILQALNSCIDDLQNLVVLLKETDKTSLPAWLMQAKEARENILP